jgi:hypothetical protein
MFNEFAGMAARDGAVCAESRDQLPITSARYALISAKYFEELFSLGVERRYAAASTFIPDYSFMTLTIGRRFIEPSAKKIGAK